MSKVRAHSPACIEIRLPGVNARLPTAYVEILSEQIRKLDEDRRRYPLLFDLMFRALTPRGRRFERKLDDAYAAARRRCDAADEEASR